MIFGMEKFDIMDGMASPGTWIECTQPDIGPYLAFVPEDLPPTPPLEGRRLWALTEEAGYELGQLRDLERRLPAPELLAVYPAIREAHASARVEGTTTTLAQALGFEEVPQNPQQMLDYEGIVDHLEAQDWAINEVKKKGFDMGLVRQAHSMLVRSNPGKKVEPGKWRSQQNYIPGPRLGIEAARHVPPPPEAVPEKMAALERFLAERAGYPQLVAAALAHAQFELIHPFADGNGRMGRMLILLQLLAGKQLTSTTLFLSDFFRVFREKYFGCLTAVAREGAWESWVGFFLLGVAEVAQATRTVGEKVIGLHASLRQQLPQHHKGPIGEALLSHLFRSPRINVADAARDLQKSIAPVNIAVNRFTEAGWLRQVTPGRRNRVFVFQAYWDVLKEAGRLDRNRIQQRLAPFLPSLEGH